MTGLRARLRAGEVVIGTMVFEFASPGLPQILANSGADFVVYDMEHSGFGIDTIKQLLAWTRGTGIAPVVRVPAAEYHFLARALDAGAHGVMVPLVESGEQAARAVQATKYPPRGCRGAAFGFAHDGYAMGDVAAKIPELNDRTLVIVQIETAAGLEQVDEILRAPGVDVAWVGHFDLTLSLGIPAQFEHPRFLAAMDRVLDACRTHGVAPGFMVADVETGRRWLGRGVRMLAYGSDMWLLAGALRDGLAGLRP